MLRDTAHIQEKDAEFLNKRLEKRKAPAIGQGDGNGIVEPLYTMADAERTLPLFQPVPITSPTLPGLSYEAYDAGHILGSSCVVLTRRRAARQRAPDLLRRRGPAQSAHHPRSREDAARRLPDHGEHLRRPPAQAVSSTSSTSWPTW
jgi:hypothetical protein